MKMTVKMTMNMTLRMIMTTPMTKDASTQLLRGVLVSAALLCSMLTVPGLQGAEAEQETQTEGTLAVSPVPATISNLSIPRLSAEPRLDDFIGMTPVTPLARNMTRVANFVQREPDDGDSASQRTEVYLGYDQTELYAVFLAFDNAPEQIRANMSSRENIDGDDLVEMTIDTFNDQRTAFSFRSTPLGIQWDARWTEGASRRAGFDTTLEAVWRSDGRLTDEGYMVKIAIPLRSLRFPDREDQLWRVQFGRHIPRLSEWAYWPAYSIDVEGRLNQTALLRGVRDVSPGNNYQIIPFIFSRDVEALDPEASGGPKLKSLTETDVGVDAKFVFNDSMVLDVTLNPDFSQVESDEPQVTVNERFEVQFPERRPFFVENADFFATDSTLVFTRRIVDPEAGLRFTGRAGNYGFGAILINDEAPGQNDEQGKRRRRDDPLYGEKAEIAILRGYRDISEQDRVGFLLSERRFGDGNNRVVSIDGRFRLDENWSTQMQVVGTRSEPLGNSSSSNNGDHSGHEHDELRGYQRNIQVNHSGRTVNTHTHFIETTSDYVAELGFQQRFFRNDTSGLHHRMQFNFFPEDSNINRWSVTMFSVYLESMDGTKIFHQNGPSFGLNFDTREFELDWTDYNEVLRPGDFDGIVTNMGYDYATWEVGYTDTTLSSLEFEVEYIWGSALNLVPPAGALPAVADTKRIEADLLWRPFDRLRVANTYLHTELETQAGAKVFSNQIIRSNWNYQFTREWSLRFIAQYEETDAGPATRLIDDRNLNFDLLLRYVINPWSAFYAGYNSNRSNFAIVESEGERELLVTDGLRQDGEQFFVKFSYLFQR